MGHAHTADQKIENPGTLKGSSTLMGVFGAFVIIGAIAFFTTLASNPVQAWASFLTGHFYFMALAMGGLFFVAIHWITTSMWSVPVMRIAESFTAYLPVVLISVLVLFLGMHHLYPWTHPEFVNGDLVLEGKKGYLNINFFRVRDFLAVVVWILFAKRLVSSSLKSDEGADFKAVYGTNRKIAVSFLAVFAITYSMTAFDQLMSLDPHWFSTMFGVYVFAGTYQSFFSMLAIVVICMKRSGYLSKLVNVNHQHDIAKMMFAFTVFWAYTGFSQFMLIWYANLPEETGYFIHRLTPGWENVSIALFLGKFIFPFLALLPRGNKRNENVVLVVAVWILCMQFLDLTWMIQPEFSPEGFHVGFAEVGTWLGFLGLFGLMVMRFLKKNNVVAIKNPYLSDSVYHHHI